MDNDFSSEEEECIGRFNDDSNNDNESLKLNDNIDYNITIKLDNNDLKPQNAKTKDRKTEVTQSKGRSKKEKTIQINETDSNIKTITRKRNRSTPFQELNQNEKNTILKRRKKRKVATAKKWRDSQKKYVDQLENDVVNLRKKKEEMSSLNNIKHNLNYFLLETLPSQLQFIGNKLYRNIPSNETSLLTHIENVQLNIVPNEPRSISDMVVKVYLEQVKDLIKGYDELVQVKEMSDK